MSKNKERQPVEMVPWEDVEPDLRRFLHRRDEYRADYIEELRRTTMTAVDPWEWKEPPRPDKALIRPRKAKPKTKAQLAKEAKARAEAEAKQKAAAEKQNQQAREAYLETQNKVQYDPQEGQKEARSRMRWKRPPEPLTFTGVRWHVAGLSPLNFNADTGRFFVDSEAGGFDEKVLKGLSRHLKKTEDDGYDLPCIPEVIYYALTDAGYTINAVYISDDWADQIGVCDEDL